MDLDDFLDGLYRALVRLMVVVTIVFTAGLASLIWALL